MHSATRTGARSCACSAAETSRSGRSLRPCPSAGPQSPATSACLKDAGLVAERAQGTNRIYQLQEQGLQAIRNYLEGVWGDAAVRFRLLAENTEQTPNR